MLGYTDGERRLTDLRHVGQLLHSAAAAERLGTAALAIWLRQRIDAADERGRRGAQPPPGVRRRGGPGADDPPLARGSSSRSSTCPYLWEPTWVDEKPNPIVYHDPDAGYRRTIDVGLAGREYRRHKELAHRRAARRGPAARVRRADPRPAPGRRLVGGHVEQQGLRAEPPAARPRAPTARVAVSGSRPPSDDEAIERFRELASTAPGLRLGRAHRRSAACPSPGPTTARRRLAARSPRADVRRASCDRARWRRTSYSRHHRRRSARSRAAGRADAARSRVRSRDEPRADRTPAPAPVRGPTRSRRRSPSIASGPLAARPSVPGRRCTSARSCTTCFEAADFAAPDLDAGADRDRAGGAAAPAGRHRLAAAVVVAGLRAALETPLGPLVGGLRLCDVQRADRLDELGFELPLAGGDDAGGGGHAGGDRRAAARAPAARTIRSRPTPTGSPIPTCARACAAT